MVKRIVMVVLVAAAAVFSSACWVQRGDQAGRDAGQWYACEEYQTPFGKVTGCQPTGYY